MQHELTRTESASRHEDVNGLNILRFLAKSAALLAGDGAAGTAAELALERGWPCLELGVLPEASAWAALR
jgi:hypothetical protein